MKKISTIFLQVAVMLFGIVVLVALIRFPMTEGRAANLDLFSIYADPFILFGYVASIPFFTAQYQIFKLLGLARQNNLFSSRVAKTLKTIKYCATLVGAAIVLAAGYIRPSFTPGQSDDPAGFFVVCIVTTLISIGVAVAAAMFEKRVRARIELR